MIITKSRIKPVTWGDLSAGYLGISKHDQFTFSKGSIFSGTGAGRDDLLVTSEGIFDFSTGEPLTSGVNFKHQSLQSNQNPTLITANMKSEHFALALITIVALVTIVALIMRK